jgi:hypothetical protein
VKTLQGILEGTKIEILGVAEVKGPPKKAEFDKVLELAETIDEKLNSL